MAKRLHPGTAVAGITIAALLAVGVLAVQAASSAPDHRAGIVQETTPAPSGSAAPPPAPARPPVPADSGSGKRVVYSLGADHVWLVDEGGKAVHDYKIAPATLRPEPGTYSVTLKQEARQSGSDGLPITHSVRFGYAKGKPAGFASTTVPLEEIKPTGAALQSAGIRSTPGDGEALWLFALIGTPVIVVP